MKNYIRFMQPEYFQLDPWQWEAMVFRCRGHKTWRDVAQAMGHSNPRKVREHLEKGRNQAQRWAKSTGYKGNETLREYLIAREIAVDAIML